MDTGVLYALFDKSDSLNQDSRAIMLVILKGNFGSPFVLDYAILEVITLFSRRRITRAIRPLLQFLDENKFRISFVTEEIFREAIKITTVHERPEHFLNLTDSSEIVTARNLGIKTIATFDTVLGSFFADHMGEGYFQRLDEKERQLLSKVSRPSS
ncbi:MAG: type II toxin-antitoxin system VapC family toxin [Nitrososphaerales archaeon]